MEKVLFQFCGAMQKERGKQQAFLGAVKIRVKFNTILKVLIDSSTFFIPKNGKKSKHERKRAHFFVLILFEKKIAGS